MGAKCMDGDSITLGPLEPGPLTSTHKLPFPAISLQGREKWGTGDDNLTPSGHSNNHGISHWTVCLGVYKTKLFKEKVMQS